MSNDLTEELFSKITSVVGSEKKNVTLHEPEFSGNEWLYVKDCLDSGWVSSVGKYVDLFEKKLAEISGTHRAIACVNGTAALHICLQLLGVKQNDEVLCPAVTFIATTNAISYCGALPHFVDSEYQTLGISPKKLQQYLSENTQKKADGCFNKRTGNRIKALVAVHIFGHPVDIDPIKEVCDHFQIEFIEDAAESLGSLYKGKHAGSFAKLSALSFNGNKVVTTGGGGAILANDTKLGELAKHITTTAKVPHAWAFNHDMIGYNYRMPNINAALGCAQLESLPSFIKRKRALAEEYKKVFMDSEGYQFLIEPDFAQSNYWLNAVILSEKNAPLRNSILDGLNKEGVMTRPIWTLMPKLPMFAQCPRMADLSVAEELEKRTINIPSSAHLGNRYVK
jgi:perosamine synthetase